jgi:hypothetical protein
MSGFSSRISNAARRNSVRKCRSRTAKSSSSGSKYLLHVACCMLYDRMLHVCCMRYYGVHVACCHARACLCCRPALLLVLHAVCRIVGVCCMSHGAYDVLRCKLHAAIVHSRRMAALWCTARACPTQLILHVRAACHADVVDVLHMLLHLPRAASCTAPVVRCVSRVARRSAVWCRGRILHGVRCMRSLWALPAVQQCATSQSSVSGPIRSGVAAVRPCAKAKRQRASRCRQPTAHRLAL